MTGISVGRARARAIDQITISSNLLLYFKYCPKRKICSNMEDGRKASTKDLAMTR